MNEQILHTDDKADIIASLTMLSVALDHVTRDISAWKWVVISTHSALQGAIAGQLRATGNNLLVAKKKDAEAWLKAHYQGAAHPELKMDTFPNLYRKLKRFEIEGYKFAPRGNQGKSIKKINQYRNDFVHFMVNGYILEISNLPNICKDCLDVINELDSHTLYRRWHTEEQHDAFCRLLISCREKLDGYKLLGGT